VNVIIDRFEGDYAICGKEDRNMMDIKGITMLYN